VHKFAKRLSFHIALTIHNRTLSDACIQRLIISKCIKLGHPKILVYEGGYEKATIIKSFVTLYLKIHIHEPPLKTLEMLTKILASL
jgi:hypothetical protein